MMNNFFTVRYGIVASTGVYVGQGMARSYKAAYAAAVDKAWKALAIGDAKANYCSGIAVEWANAHRNGKLVGSHTWM